MTASDSTLPRGSRDMDVAILVVSCDAYQDLWHPFFHCFFKYWPDCPYSIYLGSNFLTYPDSRVQPILVGPDVDYTSNLITMLNHIDQQWVILWIEDRVVSASVDTTRLTNLIRLAQSRQVGYLKLIANHPFAIVKDKTQEIGEIPKGARYRVGITVALWNKPVLLKLLCPGETPWDIERRGSERSNDFHEKFCALSRHTRNDPPLRDTHLIIKGRLIRDARQFLEQEGILEYLVQRKWQTLRSFWYVRLYLWALDTYSVFKWWWRGLCHSG